MDTKNRINDCVWEITDDGTLVIRPVHENTDGHLFLEESFPDNSCWPWCGKTFKKIRIEGHVIAGSHIDYMFLKCPALEDVSGIGDLDTSRVESMDGMFSGCSALRTLAGLEKLDTSGVNYMNYMFAGCTVLEDITALSAWNVGSVQSMYGLFTDCAALKDVSSLAKWDTDSLTETSRMFAGCRRLKDISGLKSWETERIVDTTFMFYECASLSDISALAGWDAANIVTMSCMFFGCTTLKDISALKNWYTESARNMSGLLYGCTSLEDASPLAGWRVDNVVNMYGMFRECTALRNIDGLENWNICSVADMDLMFTNCTLLKNRETLLDEWKRKNRQFHSVNSFTLVVSEERIFPMSDGPMACPREGEFVGWKKCREGKLVKLLIPADARRSSALGKKCRCDKAQVLDITDMDGSHFETAYSINDDEFIYRTGETVSVPDFDEDRFHECAPGIHFFMDKMSAAKYL